MFQEFVVGVTTRFFRLGQQISKRLPAQNCASTVTATGTGRGSSRRGTAEKAVSKTIEVLVYLGASHGSGTGSLVGQGKDRQTLRLIKFK